MFGDELIIGSVRAQVNHLKNILDQIEADERLKGISIKKLEKRGEV